MSRTWTVEETKCLISHYESLPELWDTSYSGNKCRRKKMAASEKLAKIFETTPAEINRKLHNLRTQYHNERRKLKRKRSEAGARRYYTSTWEYFASLNFLMNSGTPSETEESLVVLPNSNPVEDSTIAIPDSINKDHFMSKLNSEIPNSKEKVRHQPISNPPNAEDDEATFGNFVASAIRNLRSEVRKRELKRKIQRAILEIEELDEADQLPQLCVGAAAPNDNSTSGIGLENRESSPEIKIEYDDPSYDM